MRIVCPYAQSKLVSPSGRDVAQRQRGLIPADMAFPICFGADLPVFCPLSHLLRKCQLSQGESREVGANLFAPTRNPNLSLPLEEMSHSDREGWYQLTWLFQFALTRTCLRAALSVICFANASSPKGRAEKPVRTAHLTHQADSCADLPACCSFRHGLRRATFLREEGFGFTRNPNLSLPLGEMSRSDREGWNQLARLFRFALIRTFFVFRTKQKRAQICTLFFGGRWWIRTTEVVDNRFTVCPLWPLGKPPISTCRNRGAGGRT